MTTTEPTIEQEGHSVTVAGVLANLWESLAAAVVAGGAYASPAIATTAGIVGALVIAATADAGTRWHGKDARKIRGAGLALVCGGLIGSAPTPRWAVVAGLATLGVSAMTGRESWAMVLGGSAERDKRRSARLLADVGDAIDGLADLAPSVRHDAKAELVAMTWAEILSDPYQPVGGIVGGGS